MKKGISLIAVLMFMLAATTASVVLYKWLDSENYASAARLKQSEAYQASEAGLDAVYSWLSYKSADVGYVVKNFFPDKKAFDLTHEHNNVLGSLSDKQSFKVYLTGVDTVSRPFKLKFLSVGKGRDSSEVKQTAIYSVDGLYKIGITGNRIVSPTDFDEDFWGNMGTVGFLDAMRAVITQSPEIKNAGGQALNEIKIGNESTVGYLVLDGNFYANNGINVYGDVYSTGDFDFCGKNNKINGNIYIGGIFHPKDKMDITGDAFFNGGINPNASINTNGAGTGGCSGQATGGVVSVGNNSTIKGNFVYWNNPSGGGLGFHVAKNLVMDAGVINLTRQKGNSADSLSAYGNVYIKNDLGGVILQDTAETTWNNDLGKLVPTKIEINSPKTFPFFGNGLSNHVCVPNMMEIMASSYESPYVFPSSHCSDPISCWKNTNDAIVRTKASEVKAASPSCLQPSWNANTLEYLKSKLSSDPGVKSCENPPIQFDASVYAAVKAESNIKNWVHRKDVPGNCALTGKCKGEDYICGIGNCYFPQDFVKDNCVKRDDACYKCKNFTDACNQQLSATWNDYWPPRDQFEEVSCGGTSNKYCSKFDDTNNKDFCDNTVNKYMELAFPSVPNAVAYSISKLLPECYDRAKSSKQLYDINNNEWLVVYVKEDLTATNSAAKENTSLWGGLANPEPITRGKYIIVLEISTCVPGNGQCKLYLPPTAEGVEVMLYLPKGYPGLIELSGTPNKPNDYNYFIFSDGNIHQFNTTSTRRLHGTIFMNNCSVMNSEESSTNPYFYSESNSEFLRELLEQGFLCTYEDGGKNCEGVGGRPPTNITDTINDNFFAPISPRLKVALENKNISKEKANGAKKIESSVLVMPRVISFKKSNFPGYIGLKDYYNFFYLNHTATEKQAVRSPASCKVDGVELNQAKPEKGIYTCEFSNVQSAPKISEFYLRILD